MKFILSAILCYLLAAFTAPAVAENNPCGVALFHSFTLEEKTKSIGVTTQIQQIPINDDSGMLSNEDRYYLKIKFGKLTISQFNELHGYFGGKSKVNFDSNRSYDLIDFLSPLQQALVNKTFASYSLVPSWGGDLELSDEVKWNIKLGVEVLANCWNTAWEVTRLNNACNKDHSYYLYWPHRQEADETLKNDKYAALVADKDIQNGDMLIISNKYPILDNRSLIQHAVVFITPDIVFEKTNGSENDPFRISYAKDIFQKYRKEFGDGFSYEIRRFNQSDRAVLATPILAEDDLKKKVRQIPGMEKHPGPLAYSVEIGMGGGNDLGLNGILIFQVRIDPKTGRGLLVGQPQDLEKFKNLK